MQTQPNTIKPPLTDPPFSSHSDHIPTSTQPNTIKLPHCNLALYCHSGPPKKHQTSISRGHLLPLESLKPREAADSQLKSSSHSDTKPNDITTNHNQTSVWHSFVLLPFGNIKRQGQEARNVNFNLLHSQLKSSNHSDTEPNDKTTKHNQTSVLHSFISWPFGSALETSSVKIKRP